MLTCYEKVQLDMLEARNMCYKCCNYSNEPTKNKTQWEMGKQFHCTKPSSIGHLDDEETNNCIINYKGASSSDNEVCLSDELSPDEEQVVLSPPRKTVRASPNRVTRPRRRFDGTTSLVSPLRKSRRGRPRKATHVPHQVTPDDIARLQDSTHVPNQETPDDVARLQDLLNVAEEKIRKLNLSLTRNRMQLSRSGCITAHRRLKGNNPTERLRILVRQWRRQNIPVSGIADAMVQVISGSKKLKEEVSTQIIKNDQRFSKLSTHYKMGMYKELQFKFRAWMCLQQIDLNPTVSFRGYDIIRKTEFAEENKQRYRRGLLSSRHKLGRLCRQLETYGSELLPYTITENSVKFDIKQAVEFLLKKHYLWEFVENRSHTTIAATCDGGEITWNLSHVSAGVKIVDSRSKNPLTGDPLFGNSGHEKVQSKVHCYPLYIIFAKDNKELYQTHLSQFFKEVNQLEEDYPEGIDVVQGADMCSLQKTLGTGGAMKAKTYACYCCTIHRDDLTKPNDNPCEDCMRLSRLQPCYHKSVCDESIMDRMKAERDECLKDWPHLQNLPYNRRSRLRCGDSEQSVQVSSQDPMHIEFEPRTAREKVAFRALLEAEAQLRNLNNLLTLPTAELRIHLHEILIIEKAFELLISVINATNFDEAMIRLEQALPCLLHLENRVSETILEHLIRKGLELRDGDPTATTQLISRIEALINEKIFGSIGCSSNWTLPINVDGTLGKIKLANWRARRIIEEANELVMICLPGDERAEDRNKWCSVINCYTLTIKQLHQKEDFTPEQIDDFQSIADDFFKEWIDLVGYDGVTNYIHMLGAGHLRYYLTKWKNLHRFQNQGWEAYNAMIASFWHHRTQKGGGRRYQIRSKILPVARWVLRLMLWRTGEAQKYFASLDDDSGSNPSMTDSNNDGSSDYDDFENNLDYSDSSSLEE